MMINKHFNIYAIQSDPATIQTSDYMRPTFLPCVLQAFIPIIPTYTEFSLVVVVIRHCLKGSIMGQMHRFESHLWSVSYNIIFI